MKKKNFKKLFGFTRLVKPFARFGFAFEPKAQSGSKTSQTKFRFAHSYGFTLAEVLITLSILGVVAAITVPSLIKRNEERSTVTKVLKNISILSDALDEMLVESNWSPPASVNPFVNQLYKRLNYTKYCSESNQGCGATTGQKSLNGSVDWYTPDTHGSPLAVLKDGTVFYTFGLSDTCEATVGTIRNACWLAYFDINGPKAPNQIGRDIFRIVVTKNGAVADNSDDCRLTDNGYGCAGYILKHKNMNYLH